MADIFPLAIDESGNDESNSLSKILSDLRQKYSSVVGTTVMMELGMINTEKNLNYDMKVSINLGNNIEESELLERHKRRSIPSNGENQKSVIRHDETQSRIGLNAHNKEKMSGILKIKEFGFKYHKYYDRISKMTNAEYLLYFVPNLQFLSILDLNNEYAFSASARNLVSYILFGNDTPISSMNNQNDSLLSGKTEKDIVSSANELASFLRILAHELSLEEFSSVENKVFSYIFSLIHATNTIDRLSGIYALDACIGSSTSVPSADEEKKSIKFANTISQALRACSNDYLLLSALTKALGKMAVGSTNVDYVDFEVTRALEWLVSGDYSSVGTIGFPDRRLAACLIWKELAFNAPSSVYTKTFPSTTSTPTSGSTDNTHVTYASNQNFMNLIFPIIWDKQHMLRVCAVDALAECLKILLQRKHKSITAILCNIYKNLMEVFHKKGISSAHESQKDSGTQNHKIRFTPEEEAAIHGSLLILGEMMDISTNFMLPRFEEVCNVIISLIKYHNGNRITISLIQLEIMRLIPRLAKRCCNVFRRKYLDCCLDFLLYAAEGSTSSTQSHVSSSHNSNSLYVDTRPPAFVALGQLSLIIHCDQTDSSIGIFGLKAKMEDLFLVTRNGLLVSRNLNQKDSQSLSAIKPNYFSPVSFNGQKTEYTKEVLYCCASLVKAFGDDALPFVPNLVNDMFNSAGLSEELIESLNSIANCLPWKDAQVLIRGRLLQEISTCLTSTPASEVDNTSSMKRQASTPRNRSISGVFKEIENDRMKFKNSFLHEGGYFIDFWNFEQLSANTEGVRLIDNQLLMNDSKNSGVVARILLSLRTLTIIGDNQSSKIGKASRSTLLLPYVHSIVSEYLFHPAVEVRKEASLACTRLLLLAHDSDDEGRSSIFYQLGSTSKGFIEEVIKKLLRVAVSDSSPLIRHCVVASFDFRYNIFLCQTQHLPSLFLLLQDEFLAVRATSLQLLGRLALYNPANILPPLRRMLMELIMELNSGTDSGGREAATRLLIVILRSESLHRLIHPYLPVLIQALPLDIKAPRLASAALEALGELAVVSRTDLAPWISQLMPLLLSTIQDQSSASKQKTSFKTLGKIAGATGYVIQPYLDYPKLLSQAADVLPTTKRAPWQVRREVIRTLGILGALDPNRYLIAVASPKARKSRVGVGYFIEQDEDTPYLGKLSTTTISEANSSFFVSKGISIIPNASLPHSSSAVDRKANDDDEPAHLYMYEQYSATAQPAAKLSPSFRITPSNDEDFYPTIAIDELTKILKDPSLSMYHLMVMQAVMFIFNALGLRCVPFLKQIVPHILDTILTCSQTKVREALLQQVASLSGIVREHLRPFVPAIFEVIEKFWTSSHLATILLLVSKMAEDFRVYVPRFMKLLLASLEAPRGSPCWSIEEVERLELILRNIDGLRSILRDYLHQLVPALLKLTDSTLTSRTIHPRIHQQQPYTHEGISIRLSNIVNQAKLSTLAVLTIKTLTMLLEDYTKTELSSFLPARVIQPFMRILTNGESSKPVGFALVEALCVCACALGKERWMPLYHDACRHTIKGWTVRIASVSSSDVSDSSDNEPASPLGLPRQETFFSNNIVGLAYYDEYILNLTSKKRCTSFGEALIFDGATILSQKQPSFESEDETPGSMLDARKNNVTGNIGVTAVQMAGHLHNALDYGTVFEVDTNNSLPSSQTPLNQPNRLRVNQSKLQRAWDNSQCTTREDWEEWMRRFAIQLLREAPSPAFRATAALSQIYQPLSRSLFTAAFSCCWDELSDHYRSNLIRSLEAAFIAEASSPEILQTLLNLAEFMEHDGVDGLPIDISILADLALRCSSYAKALHYKEGEYHGGVNTIACVESLISINKKLDIPEAALGILKFSQQSVEMSRFLSYWNYHQQPVISHSQFLRGIPTQMQNNNNLYSYKGNASGINRSSGLKIKESWLVKLGSFSEALAMYERKLKENPKDSVAILGCMRCLNARGEWRGVLDLAKKSWEVIINDKHPKSRRALKYCAQASWRLGQWNDLEVYAKKLCSSVESTLSKSQGKTGFRDGGVIDFDGAFYSAVLHIHRNEWSLAEDAIDSARSAMDSHFTALMAESYKRAYPSMVIAQTLAEMEEIISFRKLEFRAKNGTRHAVSPSDVEEARKLLLSVWRKRLAGCRVDGETHSSILAVRSLILGAMDMVDATLTFSVLSRQANFFKLAEKVLLDPLEELGANLNGQAFGFSIPPDLNLAQKQIKDKYSITSPARSGVDQIVTKKSLSIQYVSQHEQFFRKMVLDAGGIERLNILQQLYFAYVKHLWYVDKRDEAIHRLFRLCDVVDLVSNYEKNTKSSHLQVSCWLKFGDWRMAESSINSTTFMPVRLQSEVLAAYKRATNAKDNEYKAWHAWAFINFRLAQQVRKEEGQRIEAQKKSGLRYYLASSKSLRNHVVAAVHGFVNAICLGTKRWSASVQQDMLNFLTCLFQYGDLADIAAIINEYSSLVTLEAWLGILPQLLARIHIQSPAIRSVLHSLLIKLGQKHPQALMYPLSVLLKSPVIERKRAAESLMTSLKAHSNALVEEAQMVSSELVRVAILWVELWHDGLEDASRLYFGEGNVSGMLDVLLPLHEQLERGPTTKREHDFVESFGRDLATAHAHVKEYVRLTTSSGRVIPNQGGFFPGAQDGRSIMPSSNRQNSEAEAALNQAWDLYYTVFRRINKQLPGLTTLELSQCSPLLLRAFNLELGIPGSYRVDGSYVKIEKFHPSVQVISTKQRPRKIILKGSDGKDYPILLKGHEDLRQDERVMQLFGLINALLVKDRRTNNHDLNIQRYTITPLSHNAGLVSWVPHSDTFHSLIRDYREERKISLNIEHREMMKVAPDYDRLTVMQKVEVFDTAQQSVGKGDDLARILWMKSLNSEEWLERRTKYTRSLAVMSMVGYILGLGDRHPSNLMLDQISGRVLHIDFGDCFEVAMHREKYPEKVPFRLTRMLINAMGVSGIEGIFRSTCEQTMSVLRDNKDSLVTMLEAFVYDPLISWRLLCQTSTETLEQQDDLSDSNSLKQSLTNTFYSKATSQQEAEFSSTIHTKTINEENENKERKPANSILEEFENDSERNGAIQSLREDPRLIDSEELAYTRSLQIFSNIQSMSRELHASSRIASITGGGSEQLAVEESIARSRLDVSSRQRELMSLLEGDESANEDALNKKALIAIKRVQDKLTGNDFNCPDNENLDVADQVQRLIVQSTSSENLSQLYIGWCAFW